jgi:NAD(P)-dependent dehydrogenase (short-subunit alcohol dehydrogenase family)
MELNLSGKVVVITGGATGIGYEAAFEFLREGCKVAICGRTEAKLDEAVKGFAAEGYSVFTKAFDVSDIPALENFGQKVFDTFGKIDIWINNAGFNRTSPLTELAMTDFRYIIDVNFTAVFMGCRIAHNYMKDSGGVIMNAGAFSGMDPGAGRAVYSAVKAAVHSITQSFAAEFAPYNIRVLSYVPGMIETPMSEKIRSLYKDTLLADIPMRRFGKPSEVAKILVFMASDAASYVNGTHITIAGGKRCVQNPGYAYDL